MGCVWSRRRVDEQRRPLKEAVIVAPPPKYAEESDVVTKLKETVKKLESALEEEKQRTEVTKLKEKVAKLDRVLDEEKKCTKEAEEIIYRLERELDYTNRMLGSVKKMLQDNGIKSVSIFQGRGGVAYQRFS